MESQEKVLELANRLLQHTGIARYIQNLRQCNSYLFTQLYEALTGTRVPGLVFHAPTSESVKCQAIIDALSRQLHPHISLGHIGGELLAQRDTMTVKHLLDIFSVLFHLPPFAGEENEEEEEEEEEEERAADDSNVLSNEGLTVISEVIREELGTSYSTDSTAELLRPVPRARLPDLRPSRGIRKEESSTSTGPSSSYSTNVTSSSYSGPTHSREQGRVDGAPPTMEGTPLSITTLEDTTDVGGEGTSPPLNSQGRTTTHPSQAPEMGTPPVFVPSRETTPTPSPPCTPPRQKVLRPPLHHSTPHTSTRSRVFTNDVLPPPDETITSQTAVKRQAESPPRTTHSPPTPKPSLPSTSRDYYYTELTHPPRLEWGGLEREPVRVTRGAHTAPEGVSRPGDPGDEDRLAVERERELGRLGQSPRLHHVTTSKVSSATQTGHSQLSDGSDEETTLRPTTTPDRPPHDGPKVHFSSSTRLREQERRRHAHVGHPGDVGEEKNGELRQRLDLESRIARTRASVLSTLYQNYLRELKESSTESRPRAGRPQRAKATTRTKLGTKPKPRCPESKARQARHPPSPSPSPPSSGEPSARASSNQDSERASSGDEDGSSIPRSKATLTKVAVGNDMLPLVENEFPFVHVSPSTMRRLWQKQLQQITALTKPQTQRQQPTAVKKFAEVDRRHKALLQVIRKELDHTRRVQRQLEQRQQNQAVKSAVRARKQATARARKYYNDYELRMKAKLQKRRTKEEQIFRQAFEDGLELQRERIRELRRYAKEKKQSLACQQQDQLESLENYYRDQFAMLADSMAREREEVTVREKAQNQLVRRMHRELRQRVEREIEQLQECLDKEDDVAHFRELDAQGLRHKLNKMTFTASVK